MILDTSALMAILLHEEEKPDFLSLIMSSPNRRMSAGTDLELHVVAIRREVLGNAVTLLEEIEPDVHPVTGLALDWAIEGFFAYGKSRHRAALNFGDCFAYGLAKALNEPLLFKGADFSQTDVAPALA